MKGEQTQLDGKLAVAIKFYCEGAYPQMREKNGSDEVWIDMLSTYDYSIMLTATKQYIADGNEYAPSIASLIVAYKKQQERFTDDILQKMEEDGLFNDPSDSESEIALWNKKNRKRKVQMYVMTGIMPLWFKNIYQRYQSKEITCLVTNKKGELK